MYVSADFYTNVYGLKPEVAAVMFLIVRIVDVLWDPLVGAFVDKHNPKLGKYRSYLIWGGIPLTGFAILCFWNGFSGSLFYAYFTYVGLSMCYTLINVPYGALNASLTRDTNEITVLTSVRMFLANLGGLAVAYGIPILVKVLSPDGKINTTASANAWFITMTIYNVRAPEMLPYFMALGSIPAFIFMPMVPAIKRAIGKSKCFMYSFQSLYWVWHCCILFLWFRYSKRRYGWSLWRSS